MKNMRISWAAEEKVGFPNYSNVVYRGSLEGDIADDEDPVEALREAVQKVETVMAEERARVNELLIEATT